MPAHRWIEKEPVGVVGAITAWNFPHQLNIAKIAPAFAAGNTVVLKAAPATPWAALMLGRLAAEHTDIPPGVLNIITSGRNDIGEAITTDPRVDLITFTGSTAVGKRIMAAAADTVKKVFLELGGKSAIVALDDCDMSAAAGAAAFGICTHAGQGCAIPTRLLLPPLPLRRGRRTGQDRARVDALRRSHRPRQLHGPAGHRGPAGTGRAA